MRLPLCFAIPFLLVMATTGGSVRADVTLPPFISDHMVLQRESKAPLWGTAAPGEKVTVRFRDQEQQATADADGKWRVELKGLKVGGPDDLTIEGKNTIKLTDVLVGDVWVGSGQSNMAGNVAGYSKSDPVLDRMRTTAYPQIRGCSANGAWKVSGPQTNFAFSAILFSFAVKLNEDLDVPIGMMLGAVGGTPSGAWVSPEALAADQPSQKLIAAYAEVYPAALKKFDEVDLPRWKEGTEKAKAAGKEPGRAPAAPVKPGTVGGKEIGHLYAAHIKPFVGYGIRGVLWDQGESGTQVGGVDQYTMMGALIRGWRNEWKIGEFPFIYVQKPSGAGCAWDNQNPVTSQGQPFTSLPDAVPSVREGLYVENHVKIMTYPNVGMAISTDLGPFTHPVNKSGYGSRAATVALGMAYGKPVEYYGPVYESHTVDGNTVRVKFTHVGKGLAFKHGDKLQGFTVAGEDKVFHWADAKIDGDTVVLTSTEVARPTAVRYGWGNNRTWANFFNKDGLPAVTFRTDAW